MKRLEKERATLERRINKWKEGKSRAGPATIMKYAFRIKDIDNELRILRRIRRGLRRKRKKRRR